MGDFGLAAQLEFAGDRRRTICGTPNYIAPEILESKHGHSFEVDIWSLGVIVYTMVFGRPPFETSDVKTTWLKFSSHCSLHMASARAFCSVRKRYKRIRMNQYSFPESVCVSGQVKDSPWCKGMSKVPGRDRLHLANGSIAGVSWLQICLRFEETTRTR